MKKFNLRSLIFTAWLLTTVFFSTVSAQEEPLSNDAPKQNPNQARRPNLLAELNLSPDQIQQIRRINREKQPLIREARQRVKEANSSLDKAIYADVADETEIQNRLKEAQTAQAEFHKIRSLTEYAVRKILNPDQLIKFREVRRRFADRIDGFQNQRNNRPLGAPGQKLINRQRKMRQSN